MTELDSITYSEIHYGSRGHRAPRRTFNLFTWLGVKIKPTGRHRGNRA